MDFNPDEAIAAGWLRADSLVAKFLERLSRFSLQHAETIFALDRFMRDRIVAKGIPSGKVAVIPPWTQDGDVQFDAVGREEFRAAHGLADKFVVMYSGNHSPVHPLDTVMQAADILRAEPDIVFAFIGGGSEFQRIKKWGAGNSRVLCLPYLPLAKLSGSLSAADAQVVVMGNAMLGLVHPCKIYNILAVGAPLVYIGPQPSHVTEIMGQLPAGYPRISVQHDQSKALAEGLRYLADRGTEANRELPKVVMKAFSKATLLSKMVGKLLRAF